MMLESLILMNITVQEHSYRIANSVNDKNTVQTCRQQDYESFILSAVHTQFQSLSSKTLQTPYIGVGPRNITELFTHSWVLYQYISISLSVYLSIVNLSP